MTEFTRAKRGDIVVVRRTTAHTFSNPPRVVKSTQYRVGRVTNIDREGSVTKWAEVGFGETPKKIETADRLLIVSKDDIDVEGALDAARAHHYDGHPKQPMPFGSLDDVRAALAPFRKEVVK